MSFRFRRFLRIAPGLTLNLSKSTAALSFGLRGAKYTVSPRGNRVTAGLPGTGLFYAVHEPRRPSLASAPRVPKRNRLNLGFFQRLFTPVDERALVDGLKALNVGDEGVALAEFEKAAGLPDAAWMAGLLRLRRGEFGPARRHLEAALCGLDRLGSLLEKYGIAAEATFPGTPEVDAHARPRERGTLLALVEIARLTGDCTAAMRHVERLLAIEPNDPVVLLSFAELPLEGDPHRAQMGRAVALTTRITNETPVNTALLLYRDRALARLGLPDAAIDVLTLAPRRRKDAPRPSCASCATSARCSTTMSAARCTRGASRGASMPRIPGSQRCANGW